MLCALNAGSIVDGIGAIASAAASNCKDVGGGGAERNRQIDYLNDGERKKKRKEKRERKGLWRGGLVPLCI